MDFNLQNNYRSINRLIRLGLLVLIRIDGKWFSLYESIARQGILLK